MRVMKCVETMKKSVKIPLTSSEMVLLYVFVQSIVAYLFPLSEMVKGLFAVPLFLFIPFLFGECILTLLGYLRRRTVSFVNQDFPSYFIFCILIGFYYMWGSALLLRLSGIHYLLMNFHLILLIPPTIILIYKRKIKKEISNSINIDLLKILQIVLIIFMGFIPVMLVSRLTPFPMSEEGVTTELGVSIQLPFRLNNKGFMEYNPRWLDFLPVAIVSKIGNINPSSFLWFAPFVLTSFYACYLYLLSLKLSDNKTHAILTVLFGILINLWAPGDIQSHYKSNQVIGSFFPALLYYLHSQVSLKKYEVKDVIKSLIYISLIIFGFLITWHLLMSRTIFTWDALLGYAPGFKFGDKYILPFAVPFLPLIIFFLGCRFEGLFMRDFFGLLFFISLTLYFFHAYESLIYIAFIFGYLLLYYILKNKNMFLYINIFAISSFLFIYLQQIGLLNINLPSPITSFYVTGSSIDPLHFGKIFELKYFFFESAVNPIIIFFTIIGGIFALFSRKKEHIARSVFTVLFR